MRTVPVALGLLLALSLVGCTGGNKEDPAGSGDNQSCIETEAAKLLDETGSNADYAMEKAAEICK
jgi:hypothetical protein